MPDYGEIFCEAVNEIVRNQLRGLSYDLTQVCQVDNIDECDKGIYWVSTDSARFKAYSQITTYNVGDTVYVITPNNDNTQQKIIIGKKVIGSQQDITYVMPFNNITDITGNLVSGSREIGRLANSSMQGHDTIIWNNEKFESGFTRLGVQGSFRSLIPDAIEGSYGLKIVLGVKGTTVENQDVATFYLDADDMYGNPYNFDGYFVQQKVFDISSLAGFDSIKVYFYQDKDFKNSQGELIASTDGFGNVLKNNLFVNDLYICLGYDAKDVYGDSLILYSNNGALFDTTPRNKTIEWRFIQFEKNKKIKLITTSNNLPHNYTLKLYKYNINALYDTIAGSGWEEVIRNDIPLENFNSYTFSTEDDVEFYKFKAIILYNNRVIYESNILEFTNTADLVAVKLEKMANTFHIYFDDYQNFGNYYLYTNGQTSTTETQRNRKAYPGFLNTEGEIDFIEGVDRVKWIVPADNTMISLVFKEGEAAAISGNFNNEESFEEYIEKLLETDTLHKVFIWNGKYYIYYTKPEDAEQQKISYRIKQNLNTRFTNNKIICQIKHNNQTLTREIELRFDEKANADYKVELNYQGEETGFSILDWIDELNEGVKKTISAKLYSPSGEEIKDFLISWDWYKPDTEEDAANYYNPFDFSKIENISSQVSVFLKEKLTEVKEQYGILRATVNQNGYNYYGYLPISLEGEFNIDIEGIVEIIKSSEIYNELITAWDKYGDTFIAMIKSTFDNINVDELGTLLEDEYKPIIEDNRLSVLGGEVSNLKALYCYTFTDEQGKLQKSVPAFNLPVQDIVRQIGIQVPVVETPSVSAYAMRANEQNYNILKTDLSSGYLDDDRIFQGLVIGQVQKNDEKPRYGIYGFGKNNNEHKMTFSVDENGNAYFGGTLEGASGTFTGDITGASGSFTGEVNATSGSFTGEINATSGTFNGEINATGGHIGGWDITTQGLVGWPSDPQKTIRLIVDENLGPMIMLGGSTLSAEGISGSSFTISDTNINEAIINLGNEDSRLKDEIKKLDEAVDKLNDEIFVNNTIDPSWQEIEFISNISLEDKKLIVNKKKIKVLATSAAYGESSQEFNLEQKE